MNNDDIYFNAMMDKSFLDKENTMRKTIRNVIKKKWGIDYRGNYESQNSFERSLDNQINSFMNSFFKENSPFKEFDLNRLNIAQFCNLTLTFLKVKTNDRKFYSNLKKKSTLVDPKVLYREYRSYFPDSITQVWVNNNAYLPQYDNEWYNCEIKYLLSYISRVTGLFLQFNSKSYKKVIIELKRLSDDFYNNILNLSSDYYGLYVKFVDTLVTSSINYIVYVEKDLFSFQLLKNNPSNFKETYDKYLLNMRKYMQNLINGCEEIQKKVNNQIDFMSHCLSENISTEYLLDYLIYLDKKAEYYEGKRIRDQLENEIEAYDKMQSEDPKEDIKCFDSFEKVKKIKKYNKEFFDKKKDSCDFDDIRKGIKLSFTIIGNTRNFNKNISVLLRLKDFAQNEYNNFFSDKSIIYYLYHELFIINSKSPLTRRKARGIVLDVLKIIDDNKYILGASGNELTISPETEQKRRRIFQNFRFLDCCYIRGMMSYNSLSHVYGEFSRVINIMCDTILRVYLVGNNSLKLELLREIAESYIYLLRDSENKTESETHNRNELKHLKDYY